MRCFICLQFSILYASCRRVCGGGRRFQFVLYQQLYPTVFHVALFSTFLKAKQPSFTIHETLCTTQVCREIIQATMRALPQLATCRFSAPRHS